MASPANSPDPDRTEGLADPADSPQANLDTGSENVPVDLQEPGSPLESTREGAPEEVDGQNPYDDGSVPELPPLDDERAENAQTSLDQPSDDNS